MAVVLDENTVRRLAHQHLRPNVCEWWLLQQYGDSDKGIAPDSSIRVLVRHTRVPRSSLHRALSDADVTMRGILIEEARKPSISLVYVRQTSPDCVSYLKTLAEGHRTRTVTDKTQKRALRRVAGR